MSKINRENLLANLADLKTKKENLENEKFVYNIQRHWPGMGKVCEIDTAPELVRMWKAIHIDVNDDKQALTALNMNDGTFEEFDPKETKFYGYTVEEWDAEMMTKRNELAAQVKIEKLEKAIAILEKNMSEDDKFNAEMNMVDELLG